MKKPNYPKCLSCAKE